MEKEFRPGPRFSLSVAVICVFSLLGYWGSYLNFIGWPIAFLLGFGIAQVLEQRGSELLEFGRYYLFLMMWCGLMIGGLFMWLIIDFPFTQHRLLNALLGDAIMSSLFVLGAAGFYGYHKIKQAFVGNDAVRSGT